MVQKKYVHVWIKRILIAPGGPEWIAIPQKLKSW